MTVTPLRSQLLLRPRPQAQQGAIIQVARDTLVRPCEVIAVGPDAKETKVGDVVWVNVYAATKLGDDLLLDEAVVLARGL